MVVSKNIKFCYKCGIKFSDFNMKIPNYCPNCGSQIRTNLSEQNERLCAVCHHKVNRYNIIYCPYCNYVFHYNCVSHWLRAYNLCPVCLNHFVIPANFYK